MTVGRCPLTGNCRKPCPNEQDCIGVSERGTPCGTLWVQKAGQPKHNLPMPCILTQKEHGGIHRDPLGREWPA